MQWQSVPEIRHWTCLHWKLAVVYLSLWPGGQDTARQTSNAASQPIPTSRESSISTQTKSVPVNPKEPTDKAQDSTTTNKENQKADSSAKKNKPQQGKEDKKPANDKEGGKQEGGEDKKKTTKAERRAIQERQRAEKAAAKVRHHKYCAQTIPTWYLVAIDFQLSDEVLYWVADFWILIDCVER